MFWVETASRVMRRQSHLGGVIYLEGAKVKNLISVPYYWNGVPKDQAYARYLSPLRENAKNIGVPLCHLEMSLFCYESALACRVFTDLE